jgi:hypothetical protein
MTGFVGGYVMRIPHADDKRVIQYLRKEQLKRLILSESIWK